MRAPAIGTREQLGDKLHGKSHQRAETPSPEPAPDPAERATFLTEVANGAATNYDPKLPRNMGGG